MNSKVTAGLFIVLFAYSAFLTYKFSSLENKIKDIQGAQPGAVSITPAGGQAPAQAQPSPFDQPSTDPVSPQQMATNSPQTTINFKKTEHNFGTIKEGEKVRTTFKFTNTGTNPLLISNAQGSCGCTVPQWPKEPIQPGQGGEIEVEFDSNGKSGEQTKNVKLTANAPTPELVIKSTVTPKDK